MVTPLLANIVFPAFFLPYAVSIFNSWIPAVALGCEFLAANTASTIIGFVLCGLIPVPVDAIRPAWGFIAFVPAYLLTVLIEYMCIVASLRGVRLLARWPRAS